MMVREFRPSDLEQVFGLARASFDEEYRPDAFLYFHGQWPQGQLVMVTPDGGLGGFIFGIRTTDGQARIMLVALRAELRGGGLGTMLIKDFESRAQASGCARIALELRHSKRRLMHFYQRLGFITVGMLQSYYSDGEDGLLMEKPLQWNI